MIAIILPLMKMTTTMVFIKTMTEINFLKVKGMTITTVRKL